MGVGDTEETQELRSDNPVSDKAEELTPQEQRELDFAVMDWERDGGAVLYEPLDDSKG
jgi:hypothetical protein